MKYVGGLTTDLLRKPAVKRGFYEHILLQRWDEIFPAYAKFMRPIRLFKGRLTIATNSPSAAHNIKMQGPYLISRLNQFGGYGAVKEIKFEIRAFIPKDEKPNGAKIELTQEALTAAKMQCENIQDEDLRRCFEHLSATIKAS